MKPRHSLGWKLVSIINFTGSSIKQSTKKLEATPVYVNWAVFKPKVATKSKMFHYHFPIILFIAEDGTCKKGEVFDSELIENI